MKFLKKLLCVALLIATFNISCSEKSDSLFSINTLKNGMGKVLKTVNAGIIFLPIFNAINLTLSSKKFVEKKAQDFETILQEDPAALNNFNTVKDIFYSEVQRQGISPEKKFIFHSAFNTGIYGTGDAIGLGLELFDTTKGVKQIIVENNHIVKIEKFPLKDTEIIKGIISHEVGHIKHNHNKQTRIVNVSLPVALYFAQKTILKKITDPFKKNILLLPTTAGLLCVNHIVKSQLQQYQERQADESVINDPCVLHALADDLESYKNGLQIKYWINRIIGSHPRTEDRAKRFRERAANLKSKQL